MTDQREAVARIIDPEAFRTLREIAAEAGLDAAKPPPGVILLDPIDGPRKAMQPRCDEALAKADAILSTLGSQAVEQPSQLQTDYDASVEPERGELEPARPLIEAIAAWERGNGTIAAIMPHEYEGFMKLLRRAAITGSARGALPASPIRREADDMAELDQLLSEWRKSLANPTSWLPRLRAALASAPKASDGESGRG